MADPTAPEWTDAERLARYQAGDLDSFGAIYDRYAPVLLVYARSLVQNASLSEDIVQEAFIRLLEYDPTRIEGSAKAFLFAVVRNLVTDEFRKAATHQRAQSHLPLRCDEPPPACDSAELSRALYQLPEEQREAVTLKVFGGMTFAQIATVTGTPAPTVMSRYRYALEKLGQLLAGK